MTAGVRVLVLGAGSIGSRHVRNLAGAGADVAVADPDPSRADALAADRVTPVPFDLDHLDRFDGIVVASPTTHHREQAEAAVEAGVRVLVEKPLAVAADAVEPLLAAADRVMVAYNLRFHPPVQRLVDLVCTGEAGTVTSVRAWFGSWLPDWRPAVDYRSTYSARRDLGGGVLLDAIHELDLLVWLLGPALRVTGAVVSRVGPLEIDVEDTVKALLLRDDGVPAEVSLDYLSRRYRRGLEVVGDRATLRLDWARAVIEVEDGAGVRSEAADTAVDASYQRQAEAFLTWLRGGPPLPVDARAGAASLALADAIRSAAA